MAKRQPKQRFDQHAPEHTSITYHLALPRDDGPGVRVGAIALTWDELSAETQQALMADAERKRQEAG